MNGEEIIKLIISGAPIRIENEPQKEPFVTDEERELATALVGIANKYGKFNKDYTGIWSGYEDASQNNVANIGVKCSNCILYEGGSSCKIVANPVEPNGKCRFAAIPDNVVKVSK